MWNNIPPANTNLNKFECLMNHRGHLERLAQTRKVINNKKPKTPSTFKRKIKNPGIRMERALKVLYENKIISDRMEEIKKKKSPYSPSLNIPSSCPAFELLGYHRLKINKVIFTENCKLYKRFTFTKPTLNTEKLNQEYQYNKYLENNISKNKNRINPNLGFIEFEKFNKRLLTQNLSLTRKRRKKMNLNIDNIYENSKRIYNIKKEYIMPNLSSYNIKNNNVNRLSNIDEENNNIIINENSDDNRSFKDNIKMKRPSSCKPNIIVINREIQENSKVFNSDNMLNNSFKTHRTKPASGKTRTNGSYSTNIMTSP